MLVFGPWRWVAACGRWWVCFLVVGLLVVAFVGMVLRWTGGSRV